MHRVVLDSTKRLTLKHFILNQQFLNLYRHSIRASRGIKDPVTRKETLAWIRSEIERIPRLQDADLLEERLKVCRRELRQILPTLR
ncbi:hypothetical protein FA15DRAFT_699045 [Coprinopsis marcescibilis]|uniref:Complex 1 LYR protein domain-containing protein n=1 Tax=Coprinopsis marcescibilis TaxID=230819 RepID=A0A5C3LD73_COPMA|nr:hypothetical protein FA15DRAFT_699045 [Coprinopsis marcescibilis]